MVLETPVHPLRSMVSHIYRLPTELLLRVVEECYSPSGLHHIALRGRRKRRAWLASTATVSHLWLDIIYPVLYHTIVLHTHRSTRLFLRSLVRNPPIAHHVVRLSFLARPELNAASTRWRLRVARGRLLPLALSLERYPYTDRDSEPRWLATCYAKIARRCPRVRRCNVAFGHMRGVLGDGASASANNGCACPWTADLEYLHVADIPFPAAVDLALPHAPGLRHLTLVWTRPSGPARTLHLLTPAHLAGYTQLEHLDLFGLRIDEAAMRAVLLALKPTLKGLKACSVTVFAAGAGAGHVAPAEWLEAPLGDSLVFRELYMCTRRRLWAHTRPLCALQGVRYLTLDLQHLPRYYQREFYPPNVKSVCFVAGSSYRSSANLFPPCVFARYAWRLIARDRVLKLQTVTIAVPSCCAQETRMWVLLSFLLTAAAQARGLEFKLNLYIMYVSGGDTFRWEPPPRPSAKERVKTVLNRLLRPKV